MRFLASMSPSWNISLFHYRNQGADYGRVLVGLQVPRGDRAALRSFLITLGYPPWDESRNPAYKLFLAHGAGAGHHRPKREPQFSASSEVTRAESGLGAGPRLAARG